MTDRDPPPVVSDVRSRHVLRFAPVETIDDPLRRDALDAAHGVDLTRRRVQRALATAGTIVLLLVVVRCLLGCDAAGLAAVQSAAGVAGAAVDTFAVLRARQIEAKGQEARAAAAAGDTLGAMRALDEALAYSAAQTLKELQEVRRELQEARARCPLQAPAPEKP